MSGPGGIAGDQLRALVERIERVEEEIKGLTEDKKDIYAEAKGNGFDVKILREVIRVRKQDPKERDEQESLLDVYLQAIKGSAKVAKAALSPWCGRRVVMKHRRPPRWIGRSLRANF